MFGKKRRAYIVEAIPSNVWNLLNQDEIGIMFLVEDRLVGHLDQEEFKKRLEQERHMRKVRASLDERLPLR